MDERKPIRWLIIDLLVRPFGRVVVPVRIGRWFTDENGKVARRLGGVIGWRVACRGIDDREQTALDMLVREMFEFARHGRGK